MQWNTVGCCAFQYIIRGNQVQILTRMQCRVDIWMQIQADDKRENDGNCVCLDFKHFKQLA